MPVPSDNEFGFAPDYDAPVPYMQRTRDYYTAIGYTTPYRWAHHVEAPFQAPKKPLAQSRVTIITTAAPYDPTKGDQGPGAAYNGSAKFYQVYDGDTAQRIGQKVCAEALAGMIAIDRQPPDHGDGNRVGSIAPDLAGGCCAVDRAGRNANIGDDAIAGANDIGAREPAFVLQRVLAQPVVQRRGFELGVQPHREVDEVRAVEAHRAAAVGRRHLDRAEARAQLVQRGAQVALRFEIGAQAQVDARHQPGRAPRSMRTPTAFAPRTAPGLESFSRTQATPNSSRMIAAQRSASVSTRPKLELPT